MRGNWRIATTDGLTRRAAAARPRRGGRPVQLPAEPGRFVAQRSIEALPRAEFEELLDGVEARLRKMGRAIFSGEAAVDPYRKGAETPCEFCDYRCRVPD